MDRKDRRALVREILRDKKTWFASFLVCWAAALQELPKKALEAKLKPSAAFLPSDNLSTKSVQTLEDIEGMHSSTEGDWNKLDPHKLGRIQVHINWVKKQDAFIEKFGTPEQKEALKAKLEAADESAH